MHNLLLIAKREYLEQVRGRAFLMTTLLLPAVLGLVMGVMWLSNANTGKVRHLAVACADRTLAEEIQDRLTHSKSAQTTVDVVPSATEADRAKLIGELTTHQISSFIFVTPGGKGVPQAAYYSRSAGDFTTSIRMRSAVSDALVEQKLKAGGAQMAEADAMVKGVELDTYRVKADGTVTKSNAFASFWKGYVMALLLTMTTMIYGMNVARSVIQEKTSRIFEVMLSIATPNEMLGGKLLGVGAVGLTQIGIWLVSGAALIGTPMAAAMLTGDYQISFSWMEIVLFPVYFLLGYLLFSALFAGLAATCETEQELQMFMPLAAAPTWLSFSMIVLIMNDSNSFWPVAASFFPPTAPIVMFLRMASETPAPWQFAVSLGLLAASVLGTVWFAAKLYRVGILMYGKRATLPELLKWLRYS